jgi:hypothetical protein
MNARFLIDFRGVETMEQFHRAGQSGEVNPVFYASLIDRSIIEKQVEKAIEKPIEKPLPEKEVSHPKAKKK